MVIYPFVVSVNQQYEMVVWNGREISKKHWLDGVLQDGTTDGVSFPFFEEIFLQREK